MGPESLGEGPSSHQQDRDYASRRRPTHLPDEPFFVQSQLAHLRQAVRRASGGLAFGTERQDKLAGKWDSGRGKGIAYIYAPMDRKFTLSPFARSEN
jgi:hypothetical protein